MKRNEGPRGDPSTVQWRKRGQQQPGVEVRAYARDVMRPEGQRTSKFFVGSDMIATVYAANPTGLRAVQCELHYVDRTADFASKLLGASQPSSDEKKLALLYVDGWLGTAPPSTRNSSTRPTNICHDERR